MPRMRSGKDIDCDMRGTGQGRGPLPLVSPLTCAGNRVDSSLSVLHCKMGQIVPASEGGWEG